VREFVEEHVKILQPAKVHVCDGSTEENQSMVKLLQDIGRLKKLDKYENCYLAISSPEDVARVEKQTYVCTTKKEDSVPTPAPGVESVLGNWKDPQEMDKEMESKFRGSMEGEPLSSFHFFSPSLYTRQEF
jgi:phosphoenolpyruvate carboxykinase (GTP)